MIIASVVWSLLLMMGGDTVDAELLVDKLREGAGQKAAEVNTSLILF